MSDDPQIQVAETIREQLGNHCLYMVGAKHLALVRKKLGGLGFKTGRVASGKANYVEIILNGNDLYDISFKKIWGHNVKVIKEYEDIYVDKLHELIEENTGLYTRL